MAHIQTECRECRKPLVASGACLDGVYRVNWSGTGYCKPCWEGVDGDPWCMECGYRRSVCRCEEAIVSDSGTVDEPVTISYDDLPVTLTVDPEANRGVIELEPPCAEPPPPAESGDA